jgi:hypothetical protein
LKAVHAVGEDGAELSFIRLIVAPGGRATAAGNERP